MTLAPSRRDAYPRVDDVVDEAGGCTPTSHGDEASASPQAMWMQGAYADAHKTAKQSCHTSRRVSAETPVVDHRASRADQTASFARGSWFAFVSEGVQIKCNKKDKSASSCVMQVSSGCSSQERLFAAEAAVVGVCSETEQDASSKSKNCTCLKPSFSFPQGVFDIVVSSGTTTALVR
jgi:hypothetical protein